MDIDKKIDGLANLIGKTPLLEIHLRYKGEPRIIYAKAEYYNLTGSIKDRIALHILKKAYYLGNIKEGDLIIEATSGNTGISFAALGSYLGHNVTIYMPDWMSEERKKLIWSYGANIELVSKEEGGFLGSIKKGDDYAHNNGNVFLPHQFSNEDNCEAHYETTGREISCQLSNIEKSADAFVAGVGTGGTIMGIGKFLKEKKSSIKLFPMEPAESPTLSTGWKIGSHRIEGISDEFIPEILNLEKLDDVISVNDGDAIIMAQKIASKLGIGVGVGISSGANLIAAIIAQEKLGKNSTVATVFSDDNKKYLSTSLMEKEPIKDYYYSTDIELVSVKSYKN